MATWAYESTITIWVQMEHKDAVTQILYRNEDAIDDQREKNGLYYFRFYDCKVSYLDLDDACNDLLEAGIAYDINIGREHENDSHMTDTYRFTENGTLSHLHWEEEDEAMRLTDLMSVVDNYQELRDLIIQAKREITPLPWDNQIEYGKRYMARQLIAPPEPPQPIPF